MSIKSESEVSWLPHPDALKIEIQKLPKDEKIKEIIIEPRMVAKKSPGRIFFASELANRFAWVEVTAEARNKLKLELAVKMLGSNRPKTATLKNISKFATAAKSQAEAHRKQLENIRAIAKPPSGMTWADFNAGKKKMTSEDALIQKRSLVAINLENSINAILGKPIPIIVYYEIKGVRVVIAQTTK